MLKMVATFQELNISFTAVIFYFYQNYEIFVPGG
jgi:hypothetical protein